MTCIVGLEHNGNVYIGGDSAAIKASTSLSIHSRSEPKVFIINNLIIGYASSFRMGQLLQYSLLIPKQSTTKTDIEYLVTDFINSVKSCFKDNNWSNAFDFLVGYKNRLYIIESDFQIGRDIRGYNACGIGAPYALGSLYSTKEEKDPKKRIITALEAAADSNAGVSGPFTVLSSEQ